MSIQSSFFKSYDALIKTGDKGLNIIHKHSKRSKIRKWCRNNQTYLSAAQVKESKRYWNQYTKEFDVNYTRFYTTINGTFDVRYIPDDLYYYVIDSYLNKKEYLAYDNKAYYPMLFDCKMPEIVVSRLNGYYVDNEYRLISENDAIKKCVDAGNIIIKPSIGTYGGRKIKKLDQCDELTVKQTFEILQSYSFVVQKILKQHPQLSAIHASSVNTIRIMTLLTNNEIHVLKPILRMGINNNFVDNASSGGIISGINPDGRLQPYAFSYDGKKFTAHPQGFKFEECVIPSFNKAIDLVKRQAQRFPYFRMIAWDVAINELSEPVLIEANLKKGGLELIQYTHGPLFGDLTDNVLHEVFRK
jgi:hypothetical protein